MLSIKELKKSFKLPDGQRLPVLDVERFEIGDSEQMVLIGEKRRWQDNAAALHCRHHDT